MHNVVIDGYCVRVLNVVIVVFGLGFRLWCLALREVPLLSWVMVLTCILGGGDVRCGKGKFVFVGCVSCSCCWCGTVHIAGWCARRSG